MKVEDHLRNMKESLEVIKESVQKGIQERQRNIGFNCSVASAEMLEIFLHKENLINPGLTVKHDWFSSVRKAKEKLNFDFPEKEKIIKFLYEIEAKRNLLCYGKPRPASEIESLLDIFYKLKKLFESKKIKWN